LEVRKIKSEPRVMASKIVGSMKFNRLNTESLDGRD